MSGLREKLPGFAVLAGLLILAAGALASRSR